MAAEVVLDFSRLGQSLALQRRLGGRLRIVVLFCDCFSEQSSQMASLGWWGMDMTTTAGRL